MRSALIILGCVVVGVLAGGGVGLLIISAEGCAGPACAGLVIIPLIAMVPGAIGGLVLGIALALRPSRPANRARRGGS